MTGLVDLLASDYPADLASAMVVNFRIAAIALGIGLALGVPFIILQMTGGIWQRIVNPIISFMRAAPTFVVMFFLLNIIPRPFEVFGVELSLSAGMTVALSLAPYAAAYFADNGRAALLGLKGGSQTEALLFLPNLIRAFVVLVMSSSAGVAIGVQEGVAVVLQQAELQDTHGERMLVFAVGVFAFGAIFQVGFAVVRTMMWYLSRKQNTREAS
jgi:ABC-type amino acid transport system permease subunit